jgi:hypothetical protein
MSVTKHHADWLQLVESSGPFVSLKVLQSAFPQGLEARDPAKAAALRSAYKEFQANPNGLIFQRKWILHVLTELLDYPVALLAEGQAVPPGLEARMPEMGETLRPDFALLAPSGSETAGQAHLLIAVYPTSQSLEKPVAGKIWKASAATRMMELLHSAGVPLGLVTNGEHWMLVYAPRGEATGYASWYSYLWMEEAITLRAFHSLHGVRRFFGVAAESSLLGLLKQSANDQQEVTDQLGYQVREAVEVLVQSFDALDRENNRTLLAGVSEKSIYEAALTVMMRLVFLFSAEERGLLHLGKPLYDENYAVSTLLAQLQDMADWYGEEVLERRDDAWARLLSTFRAVHGGVQHQDLSMQAYGGSLFDPDRFPFLEGRAAGTLWRTTPSNPLAVNNRVVLHLLSSLQRLRTKTGSGNSAETRRVSFRALGVEQIGHVYEGLLDHTAVRASEPVLGIRGTRKLEPEIPLSKLESLLAQGQDKLVDWLADESGRTAATICRSLGEGALLDTHKLRIACGQDDSLIARLAPFVGLIREDSFERPLVVLPGSVYVTAGTTRRSTGTHYTPPALTEPIVQYTLEPLVYEGPAEGWPREQWKLKSPSDILALRVCDMAMGSGAFLVQVCRYLAERLVESWDTAEKLHPGEILVSPEGGFSDGSPTERLFPFDVNERIAVARRVIADRCLYGVDINPMAVEMAKLSVWLITVDTNRSFTFLNHAFKVGDSLLGVDSFRQIEDFTLRPGAGIQHSFSTMNLWRHVEAAQKKRTFLAAMPSDTPEQIFAKSALNIEAEEAVSKLRAVADILLAMELNGLTGHVYDEEREHVADAVMLHWAQGRDELRAFAEMKCTPRAAFHWALTFPEIVYGGGFDAIVGNPPFLGGKRISTEHGTLYEKHLKRQFQAKGAADICCYFFRRGFEMLRLDRGVLGLLATKSITEGDSPAIGLEPIVRNGGTLFRARPAFAWPGEAGVYVSEIHFFKGSYRGEKQIGNQTVQLISCRLTDEVDSQPHKLKTKLCPCSAGRQLYGHGFVISRQLAETFLSLDGRNSEVIKPYINSDIFNSSIGSSPATWAIDFGEMDREEAESYVAPFDHVQTFVKPVRDKLEGQIHEDRFWLYWDKRTAFLAKARSGQRMLVSGRVTQYLSFVFCDPTWVLTEALQLFSTESFSHFGVLQSSFHEIWARKFSSTIGQVLRYSTSDAFDTFGFPSELSAVDPIAKVFYERRAELMEWRQIGLTDMYNQFHDRCELSEEFCSLRDRFVELDHAVAEAYGWTDLSLDHGFYETKQGVRYSIGERARIEILIRLRQLNQQRHAEEMGKKVEKRTIGRAKVRGKQKPARLDGIANLFD